MWMWPLRESRHIFEDCPLRCQPTRHHWRNRPYPPGWWHENPISLNDRTYLLESDDNERFLHMTNRMPYQYFTHSPVVTRCQVFHTDNTHTMGDLVIITWSHTLFIIAPFIHYKHFMPENTLIIMKIKMRLCSMRRQISTIWVTRYYSNTSKWLIKH